MHAIRYSVLLTLLLFVSCGTPAGELPETTLSETEVVNEAATVEKTPATPEESKPVLVRVDDLSANSDANTIDVLLSTGETHTVSGVCGEEINAEAANEVVLYRGTDFALEAPYNTNWGTEEFGYQAVEEYSDPETGQLGWFFGAPYIIECSWGRSFRLIQEPARSADDVKRSLRESQMSVGEPQDTTINGKNAIVYQEAYMGNPEVVVLLGTKHNYVLRGSMEDIDVITAAAGFVWEE